MHTKFPRHLTLALVVAGSIGAAAPAATIAAGNAQSGPTVGDCISDGFYGNEPNMANGAPGGPAEQAPGTQAGNVLPTQSPGPWVNNPNDPSNPSRGHSVGDLQQLGFDAPAYCRATT